MKKVVLLIAFLALSVLLYGASEVYATISNLRMATGTQAQLIRNITDSKISCSQPNLKMCGDPIIDPRPKSSGSQ